MHLTLLPEVAPLRVEADGSVRIGTSRVLLDVVVEAYEMGQSAEEIAHHFPALKLADVHAVIAYYLNHKQDVSAYLAERKTQGDKIKAQWEAKVPPDGMRAKLLAREAAGKQKKT